MAKVGRPTKYRKKYCQEMVEYFDVPATFIDTDGKEKANDLPTIAGFAISIGITVETIRNWKNKYPDFLDAYKKAKALQEEIWIQNSLRGRYNTAFTIFLGKNVFGWTDKKTVEHQVTFEDRLRQIARDSPVKQIGNVTVEDVD